MVIAANCKSVQLRAERDETKNGRGYIVALRVRDAAGNATRAGLQGERAHCGERRGAAEHAAGADKDEQLPVSEDWGNWNQRNRLR